MVFGNPGHRSNVELRDELNRHDGDRPEQRQRHDLSESNRRGADLRVNQRRRLSEV
jgi:hypothetical protein